MKKLIGFCFLTATLLATSAHAQGIYIDRGDPNAVSAAIGGGLVKDAYTGSLLGSWTYRGVFDVGAGLDYFKYTGGANKNLTGINLAPFVSWHAIKAEEDEWPVSLSLNLGVNREMFLGNTPVANPEGWGAFVGPSVYRRFEFGSSMVFVPEALVAIDYKVSRFYSGALDQSSGNVADTSGATNYRDDSKFGIRVVIRPNLVVMAGNTKYLIMPYVGYLDGLAAGANVGAMF